MKAEANWVKNVILIINLAGPSWGLHAYEKILKQEKVVEKLVDKLRNARNTLRELKRQESHKVVFPMKPNEEEIE